MKNVKEKPANLSFSLIVFKKYIAFFPFCRIILLEMRVNCGRRTVWRFKNWRSTVSPQVGRKVCLSGCYLPSPLNTLWPLKQILYHICRMHFTVSAGMANFLQHLVLITCTWVQCEEKVIKYPCNAMPPSRVKSGQWHNQICNNHIQIPPPKKPCWKWKPRIIDVGYFCGYLGVVLGPCERGPG